MSTDDKKKSSKEPKKPSESGMIKYGVPSETLDPRKTVGLEEVRKKKRG